MITPARNPRWFALTVAYGLDALARRMLDINGVERREFLFLEKASRPRRVAQRAWLPGYQFVSLDLDADPWEIVATLPGVSGLLGDGSGFPTPLRDGEIERLAEMCPRGPAPGETAGAMRMIPAGASLRITAGPFTGLGGFATSCDGRLVKFEMEVFGRSGPVTMKVGDVEVVER